MLLLYLLLFSGCVGTHYVRTERNLAPSALPASRGLTDHVILISIDGLRPDAIERFGASTLSRLMRDGSYTLTASTILPSKTLPSHTSMLTGVPPEVHGVEWNSNTNFGRGTIDSPTVFGLLHARGFQTAAFFGKSKFQHLQRPGTLDYSQAPGGWFGKWSADRTVEDIQEYLATEKPSLLFVHLGDPDKAGHDAGWMSEEYGEAVKIADDSVAQILSSADQAFGAGNYTVIVTADHGGHDKDHGSNDPRDVTIPWIAWGRGVAPSQIAESVQTMDTAATVLWLFGVAEPANWVGNPIINAFQATSANN